MKYHICELRIKHFTHEKTMASKEILKKKFPERDSNIRPYDTCAAF